VVAAVGIFSRVSTLDRGRPPASAGGQPIMASGHCQPSAECDRVAPAPAARFSSSALAGAAERIQRASP
jgi:hypothetical protein